MVYNRAKSIVYYKYSDLVTMQKNVTMIMFVLNGMVSMGEVNVIKDISASV